MTNCILKNKVFYWLDDKTFCLVFDGGIDEFGDAYHYLVEYHKDVKLFVFEMWFEDQVLPADFTGAQEKYIKQTMLDEMQRREKKDV